MVGRGIGTWAYARGLGTRTLEGGFGVETQLNKIAFGKRNARKLRFGMGLGAWTRRIGSGRSFNVPLY